MRVFALPVMVLAGCIAAATAGESVDASKDKASPASSVTPVFSQLVAFTIPREFMNALEDRSATVYLRELVLKGENADKWSQKITVIGAKGVATNTEASSLTVLQGAAGKFQRRCPTSFAVKPVGSVFAGAHQGFVAIMGCGTVKSGTTSTSEIAIVVAVRGSADDYTVQWTERGPPADQPPVLDEAKWKSRFDQLLPVRICDPVPNEAAPYPSCS